MSGDENAPTVQHARFEDDDEPASESVYQLDVVSGPDRGKRHLVRSEAPSATLIGTSSTCALQLTDRAVSRRHALVEIESGRMRLRDASSTNGTWLGSVGVHDVMLTGGEVFIIGSTQIRVTRLDDAAAAPLPDAQSFGRTIGGSVEMRRRYPLFARLAATDIPVVIEGETGTGKEVLAESLHEMGPRAGGPFVVFDCTAVPPTLMESELFGVEKGAFTGATASRRGMFEQASGGTLLIDEIGDLELHLQPKLLRVIERSEVRRVGGDAVIPVDVRVIAATRRDLDRQVQDGRFRDDLFHRLAVGRVELPPLRRRRSDVALLVRHFWQQLGGASAELTNTLLQRWEAHDWPGNVRELRNAVARQIALGDLAPPPPTSPQTSAPTTDVMGALLAERLPLPVARRRLRDEFERRYVEIALEDHGGNVSKAAAASGIARRYFQQVRARSTKSQGDS